MSGALYKPIGRGKGCKPITLEDSRKIEAAFKIQARRNRRISQGKGCDCGLPHCVERATGATT